MPGGSIQLETGCRRENQRADWGLWGPQWPTVEQPNQDAKEVLLWSRKNLGQYSSPSLSPLISLTQKKHHPLENKVWEIYILMKKCVRSLLKSSLQLIMFLCIWLRVYNLYTHTHKHIYIYIYIYFYFYILYLILSYFSYKFKYIYIYIASPPCAQRACRVLFVPAKSTS